VSASFSDPPADAGNASPRLRVALNQEIAQGDRRWQRADTP
jgi:hypothetical protein